MRSFVGPAAAVAALIIAACAPAQAWGLKGHTIIGEAAVARLPADLPAFLQTTSAKDEVTYLQAEQDRLKIGEDQDHAWAREWTTDHYLDIGDDGRVAGVISLDALPATRDDFIKALWTAPHPVDAYSVGFLPYSILEGYEQVRADFALWRNAPDAEKSERASLTIHDIGMFAHFVGDGSQPLHTTIHFNGWGDYPNPAGYTTSRTFHADFEDIFVDAHLSASDVIPLVGPAQAMSDVPLAEIGRYLTASDAQVVPLYELAKRGAFSPNGPAEARTAAIDLAAKQMAAAATMLDSLIETAWSSSATLKGES